MTPSVYAISVGGDVSHIDGGTINFFEGCQFLLEPLDLVPRIVPILQEPPVLVVARLCVYPNDLSVRESSSVLELEWHGVVAIVFVACDNISAQPFGP
jgi:hypothetical protein